MRKIARLAVGLTVLVCSIVSTGVALAAPSLQVSNTRTSAGVVEPGGVYNYVPSVLRDGVNRMWWCGSDAQHPGDHIFYAESASLNRGFHAHGSTAAYQVVFAPTGRAGSFDQIHTCDPSVLRVNGTWYMYYGGAGSVTTIGLATSPDGFNWTRANNGNPIIVPANRQDTGNGYGAGQPTAAWYQGRFYLMYTDTTGLAASPHNDQGFPEGAGQFVLRSADPTFQSGVEELTAGGFAPMTGANHTAYNGIGNWYSVDMQFSDALNAWIVAHSDGSASRLSFFTPDFSTRAYEDTAMPLSVVEGPGIVSRPDRHAVAPAGGRCGTVPVDLINATSTPVAPTGLRREGVDLSAGQSCAAMAPGQVANIFAGYGIQAQGLPLTLVVGGLRLQAASASPLQDLTRNFIDTTAEVFYLVPYGASLQVGATVVGAPGRPAAFLLDGQVKWPISALKIITDNQSSITMIPLGQYDSYPTGPALYMVQ